MTTSLYTSPSISTSGGFSIYFRNHTIWSRSISAFFLTTSHQQHDRKWHQHHLRVSTFPPLAQQSATNAISYKANNGIIPILLEGGLMRKRCSDLGCWPVFRLSCLFPFYTSPAPKCWSVWPDQSLMHTHFLATICTASRLSQLGTKALRIVALSKTDDECHSQIDLK